MKCPKCANDLVDGYAKIDGIVTGFYTSSQTCFFYYKNKKEKTPIIDPLNGCDAYYCSNCKLFIIQNNN